VATTSDISIRPSDIRPIFNYVGRSQFTADPMLKAYLDDIRIFNYALTGEEVAAIADLTDGVRDVKNESVKNEKCVDAWFDLSGRRVDSHNLRRGIYVIDGKKIRVQ